MERPPEPAANALAQARREFGQAGSVMDLDLGEGASAGRRIDTERPGLGELLAGERSNLDAVRDADRLLGTRGHTRAALDARGVR